MSDVLDASGRADFYRDAGVPIADRVRAAEQAGDTAWAANLKVEQLREVRSSQAGAVDAGDAVDETADALRAAIVEAEATDDVGEAMRLKGALLRHAERRKRGLPPTPFEQALVATSEGIARRASEYSSNTTDRAVAGMFDPAERAAAAEAARAQTIERQRAEQIGRR